MPFKAAAIACSLTPKWMFLPPFAVPKSWNFFRWVLLDGARSADPPMRLGSLSAIAFKTLPEALLVAIAPSTGLNTGRSSSHPSGSLPLAKACHFSASSGYFLLYLLKSVFHAVSRFLPDCIAFLI
jgi:hypothetical protein